MPFSKISEQYLKPRLLIVRRHGGSMPETGLSVLCQPAGHQEKQNSKSLAFKPAKHRQR